MRRVLIGYAIEGIKNKKSTTIPAFLVLCISFSFLIFTTFLVGSIQKTNDEFRVNTYGDWYVDVLDANQSDIELFQNNSMVSSVGKSCNYGTVACGDKLVGIGSIDDSLIDIGRISISEGTWPQNSDEIAMEADTLCALGYDYTLGQKIKLDINIPIDDENSVYVSEEYTLVGIVHEYTDLWTIDDWDAKHLLNSIIITDEAANLMISDMEYEPKIDIKPDVQLFLQVPEENRAGIDDYLSLYTVSYNKCAYEGQNDASVNKIYSVIILLITLIAIIFTYILQIEKMVHSFSIMRSIGMTKKQLARLIVYEALILCIPAIITGIIVGCLAIFVVLKIVVYGGSVPIVIDYNWRGLFSQLAAWIVTVVAARLIVYVAAIRAPLLGRMGMQRNQKHKIYVLRHLCIAIICICFGATVIFTGMMLIKPTESKRFIEACPSYILWPDDKDINFEPIKKEYMTRSDIDNLNSIPGVDYAYGFSEYSIGDAYLYVLDDKDWEDVFHFKSTDIDMNEFRQGKAVIMCIPAEEKEKYNIDLTSENFELSTINGKTIAVDNAKIGGILYIPYDINSRLVAGFNIPYTTLCSEEFMKNYGVEGYTRIYVNTGISTENTSTDITVAQYCKKNNIFLSNRREEYQAYKQENLQKIIMLYSVGGSIGIIFVLLMGCVLSLDKEQQKRSFIILRTLGMSTLQWRVKCFKTACLRGTCSLLGGWIIFFAIDMIGKKSLWDMCGTTIVVSILVTFVPIILSTVIYDTKKFMDNRK